MMLALKAKITIADELRRAVGELQKAYVESASLDARLLMQAVLGCSREQVLIAPEMALSGEQQAQFAALLELRLARKPMAQILGKREFYGRNFKVSEHTLDPRADSETLIEAVLARAKTHEKPLKIIDFGTGTGCLLLTLLAELPGAQGTGVDLCDKALAVAKENANLLGLNERAAFVASRWAAEITDQFDIIVANPPYIPTEDIALLAPEVALHEPKLALDGGHDGLSCYREIMAALPTLLSPGAFAAFEIGVGQEKPLEVIAQAHGLEVVEIKNDLAGIARVLIIQKQRG